MVKEYLFVVAGPSRSCENEAKPNFSFVYHYRHHYVFRRRQFRRRGKGLTKLVSISCFAVRHSHRDSRLQASSSRPAATGEKQSSYGGR